MPIHSAILALLTLINQSSQEDWRTQYKPSSAKEIFFVDEDMTDKVLTVVRDHSFVIRVEYTGKTKKIDNTIISHLKLREPEPSKQKEILQLYQKQMLFTSGGKNYWLTIQEPLLPHFKKECKPGQTLDLYLLRACAVGNKWLAFVTEFDIAPDPRIPK